MKTVTPAFLSVLTSAALLVILGFSVKSTTYPRTTRENSAPRIGVLYLQPAGTKVLFRIDTKKQRAYVLVGGSRIEVLRSRNRAVTQLGGRNGRG
jgi:hypothetical protein